jgi:hypothetical protein
MKTISTNSTAISSEATHRLLTSMPFRRCRDEAERLETDPTAVQRLLDDVETHAFAAGTLADAGGAADLRGICEAVREHLAAGPAKAAAGARARYRLMLSALLYVVADVDVIPDSWPDGHVDDLAVVRWANRLAC